jgi:hypothetical protein
MKRMFNFIGLIFAGVFLTYQFYYQLEGYLYFLQDAYYAIVKLIAYNRFDLTLFLQVCLGLSLVRYVWSK